MGEPWSDEAIAAFNREQQRRDRHPLTCGRGGRHDEVHRRDFEENQRRDHGLLVGSTTGPVCPACGWRQPSPPWDRATAPAFPSSSRGAQDPGARGIPHKPCCRRIGSWWCTRRDEHTPNECTAPAEREIGRESLVTVHVGRAR